MDINHVQSFIPNPQRSSSPRAGQQAVETLRERATNVEDVVPLKRLASPEALAEKAREAQALRVQRVNNSELLPLSSQKALQQYQSTQQFSTAQAGGELAGIDLFV